MSDGMIVTFAGDGTRFSKQTEAPYDGRIPCELLAYRPDSKRPFGRSRINRTVMSLTDSAVRTFLRSELQAELYSVPPRYFLGVTEDMFTDETANRYPCGGSRSTRCSPSRATKPRAACPRWASSSSTASNRT